MATETVAVLEWNFKNVLNGLTGLRGHFSSTKRSSYKN